MTADWQVKALVDHVPEINGVIWCPCVGDGSLMRALQALRPDLGPFVTNDIDGSKVADFHGDATDAAYWKFMLTQADTPDWIVENMPFGCAMPIVEHAFEAATKGLIVLSRISFVEPTQRRAAWMAAHPRQQQIALERYSFTQNGKSDMTTTEWLVWSKVPLAKVGGFTAMGYRPQP